MFVQEGFQFRRWKIGVLCHEKIHTVVGIDGIEGSKNEILGKINAQLNIGTLLQEGSRHNSHHASANRNPRSGVPWQLPATCARGRVLL